MEQYIEQIMHALTAPVITMPGGWEKTFPQTILDQISMSRMIELMQATITNQRPQASAADMTAYLYTASLMLPLSHDWAQIYLFFAKQFLPKEALEANGINAPDELNTNQQRKADDLRHWLYLQQRRGMKTKEASKFHKETYNAFTKTTTTEDSEDTAEDRPATNDS